MDDYDFEYFVADLWECFGWTTEVSSASNDAGIDVIAVREMVYREKVLIQAKRYGPNTTVGSPAIQQYASLRNHDPDVDMAIVVTTNEFTNQARKMADRHNVKLIDSDDLVTLIEQADAYDLVDKYVPRVVSDTEPDTEIRSAPTIENKSPSSKTPQKTDYLILIERANAYDPTVLVDKFKTLVSGTQKKADRFVTLIERANAYDPTVLIDKFKPLIGRIQKKVDRLVSLIERANAYDPTVLVDKLNHTVDEFAREVLINERETSTFSAQGLWAMVASFSILLLGTLTGDLQIIVLGWLTIPIAHWYDGRTWTQWWWAYAGLALIPTAGVLTATIHLWRRHKIAADAGN